MNRAEMEIVDLAHLRPDRVQVASFVGDLAGLGMNAWFVEALQGPEEIVGGLQTNGFTRVGDDRLPGFGLPILMRPLESKMSGVPASSM